MLCITCAYSFTNTNTLSLQSHNYQKIRIALVKCSMPVFRSPCNSTIKKYSIIIILIIIVYLTRSFSDRNECASSPCFNGKCIDIVNGYRCECQSGYTGTVCDEGKGENVVQTHFLRRHSGR